ncbi:hypothetical protein B0J17DRAFT_684740 [Rhizoctonia solani]|nr:hypothetical protein B0J17DRAFT_684740 [Rhizoctonia solani]
MSQPEASTSGRRRPYVTRACNECRRRRCKCDGEQPTCGTCAASGHECSWNPDTEASRPFTKQYIESLRVKVKLLESQIAQLQTGPSTPSAGFPSAVPSPSSINQEPVDDFQNPPFLPNSLFHPSLSLIPSATNPPFLSPTASYPPGLHVFPSPAAFPYQYIFNINLSLPFEHQTPETQASLSCLWDRHLPGLGLVKLSRIDHDEMLSQFFHNGVSWLSGLVPTLFLRDMMSSLGQQGTPTTQLNNYSPLIHCSLLAFASTFSESPRIRDNNMRIKFAAHAKNWLFDHFDDFHSTLLPSLTLLAGYHDGIGERSTGYMYLGMGARATKVAASQANTQAYVWYSWSVYAREAFSAFESGRPNEMSIPRIPIDYPTEYLEDHSSLVAETFVHGCKLATIANEVNRNPLNDSSSVANLQSLLDSWFSSLPERTIIRQGEVLTHSHVLCLHISYWWITLRLYFPFYGQGRPSNSDGGPSEDSLIRMCNRATEKLVQLFKEFATQYTFKYFPGNLLQAIALCGDTLVLVRSRTSHADFQRRAKVKEDIDSCIRALQIAGETWHRATNLAKGLQARAAG